jgi:hypothetical protein
MAGNDIFIMQRNSADTAWETKTITPVTTGLISIDENGTLSSVTQSNFTNLNTGSLGSLNITGNVTASGTVSASAFVGDGSGLTGVGGGGTVQGTDGTYDILAANEGATAGDARGENSVELQTIRQSSTFIASGDHSTIAGGKSNRACSNGATVAGGHYNYANGICSFVGGGFGNCANGIDSIVGSGNNSKALGARASVLGGMNVTAEGYMSTAGGGRLNCSGRFAGVLGGCQNHSTGTASAILGGYGNTNDETESFIIGSNITATEACHTFVNNLNVAGHVTASGTVSASAFVGDGSGLTGLGGGGTAQSADLTITPTDEGGGIAGNTRGPRSIDLQTSRSLATHVASGTGSIVLSGKKSLASGKYSSVLGSYESCATANMATVVGGDTHVASGCRSFAAGGRLSTASGKYSVAIAGRRATATGCCSLAVGNAAYSCGHWSVAIGGTVRTTSSGSLVIGNNLNDLTKGSTFNAIVGGTGHSIPSNGGCNNTVVGGRCTCMRGGFNSVLGGCRTTVCLNTSGSTSVGGYYNVLDSYKSFVVGSNITTDRDCTTFVNNLSIMSLPTGSTGLPSGSVWKDNATNNLKIV